MDEYLFPSRPSSELSDNETLSLFDAAPLCSRCGASFRAAGDTVCEECAAIAGGHVEDWQAEAPRPERKPAA